jgi:hypothetical protein
LFIWKMAECAGLLRSAGDFRLALSILPRG